MRNVPLSQIDWRADHVGGETDFQHGISLDEMRDGLRKLNEVVRPGVEAEDS